MVRELIDHPHKIIRAFDFCNILLNLNGGIIDQLSPFDLDVVIGFRYTEAEFNLEITINNHPLWKETE